MMCRSGRGTRPTIAIACAFFFLKETSLLRVRGSVAAPGRDDPVRGVPSFRGNLRRSRGILMDFGKGRQGVHVLEVTATARATTSLPSVCHRCIAVWQARQAGREEDDVNTEALAHKGSG